MTDREKLLKEIHRLLEDAPERCLRFVLSFLTSWNSTAGKREVII